MSDEELAAKVAEQHQMKPSSVSRLKESTLYRWTFAYIRHNLTDYDVLLRKLRDCDDEAELVNSLRWNLATIVVDKYPFLADAAEEWLAGKDNIEQEKLRDSSIRP